MERILSSIEMKNAEDFNINKLGISGQELIYRAGKSVADEIINRFHGGRVLVCVGKGKNGEDGRVIAKILSNVHGFSVLSVNVVNGIFKVFSKKFDIIVDCIFGTGLNRDVEGKFKTAIENINNSGAFVVSCDIPSGINADTGMVMGVAVKANLTIAIGEYKLGHFLNEGIDYSGEIISKDIGLSVWGEDYIKKLNGADIYKYFPKKLRNSHKGIYGKSLIIGGSKDFSGSAILSMNALTAFKGGAGYSYLLVPESLYNVYAGKNPECIVYTNKDDGKNFVFSEDSLKRFLDFDSIAVGMGMGVNEETYKIVSYLITNYKNRLLIDADGINSLAKFGKDVLLSKSCEIVLSPHIGEFSRLTGKIKTTVLCNSIKLAKEFAKKYGVVLLLKNATSVITDGNETYLNLTGCSGMAKAGSGDVLSGFISGMNCNRKESLFDLTAVSAYVFGLAGEFAKNELGNYCMTASDIVNYIPKVVMKFES